MPSYLGREEGSGCGRCVHERARVGGLWGGGRLGHLWLCSLCVHGAEHGAVGRQRSPEERDIIETINSVGKCEQKPCGSSCKSYGTLGIRADYCKNPTNPNEQRECLLQRGMK